MLLKAEDQAYYLIELSDLHLPPTMQPPIVNEHSEVLRQIITWAETFLCRPHPQIGRSGAVCPYVEASMKEHLLWLTLQRGETYSISDVYQQVMTYRDWFLELAPRSGKEAQFKALLILFPDMHAEDAPHIIDVVQRQLKPEFAAKGIMIGQFHPSCPEPGLWNQHFRPLQAPIPLLAIRHMVLTDFPFLKHDERFIAAYLKVFGDTLPKRTQEMIREARSQLPQLDRT